MKTWKSNLEETKQRYINWWNHKGIILNMWEHFQEGVQPHAEIVPPVPAKDLSQKWFDPQWRAEYLDWYVAHSSLKADILPVANTQLGPGSLAAILGGVFEGGEDTIWIHPNPDFTDEIVFNPEHPNWILHKELLKACKAKANGHYFVGMPDLMEGLDVLAALKGTDRVLLDTVMQPEILEQQMQQINDIYFKVFDELYDIIREGDEMAFCYFSSWAPGKMSKLQSDISTMISQDDYRRFVQPFIREQCQKIDYTLYHLDGVGAMHHLPALLEIELTETATVSYYDNVKRLFERFQKVNMQTALDDFGSGYSLLNTVIDIPVNTVKIDKVFMDNCKTSERGMYFLHQIVAVVKGLGYRVVCEGVENLEQVEVLRKAGCEEAQGFWFAHPMPVEEFEQIMYQKMPYRKV